MVLTIQQARTVRQPSPPNVFRGPDGRLYERVAPRPEEIVPSRRVCTPPAVRAAPTNAHGRRSASLRAHRPQYPRRTPSMNEDGTILQSIEDSNSAHRSPAFRQRQSDIHPDQHQIDRRRMHERHTQLIDLTSSAQQATERMRMSLSPPPSPHPRQMRPTGRDVEMDDETCLRQRRIIDLDQQLPTPASSQQRDHGIHSSMQIHDQYTQSPHMLMQQDRVPMRHEYSIQPQYTHDPVRLVSGASGPAPRQMLYEPVNNSHLSNRPARQLPEPSGPLYHGRVEQQYYVSEAQEERRAQPQRYYSDAPPRQIVLDTTIPMDGVQYAIDPR